MEVDWLVLEHKHGLTEHVDPTIPTICSSHNMAGNKACRRSVNTDDSGRDHHSTLIWSQVSCPLYKGQAAGGRRTAAGLSWTQLPPRHPSPSIRPATTNKDRLTFVVRTSLCLLRYNGQTGLCIQRNTLLYKIHDCLQCSQMLLSEIDCYTSSRIMHDEATM